MKIEFTKKEKRFMYVLACVLFIASNAIVCCVAAVLTFEHKSLGYYLSQAYVVANVYTLSHFMFVRSRSN